MVKDYELRIRRKDGTIRNVSMSGYTGRDSSGRIISYQGLIRDTTKRNRLQKQLIQAERLSAMGKMASQLAHELNNPIFGIMNCLELIKDAVPEDNYKRKFVDLAYNECKRTSILLMKMLKFFKPDNEKRNQHEHQQTFGRDSTVLRKAIHQSEYKSEDKSRPGSPPITAVESQLKQVFINMIINANAAMESGGQLLVSSCMDDGGENILIRIEDTGVGISPENLDRIFDAFFTTKKEVLKGVGLGLSICYGFIKEHGGNVDVESELGKGTRFTICLPVNAQTTPPDNPLNPVCRVADMSPPKVTFFFRQPSIETAINRRLLGIEPVLSPPSDQGSPQPAISIENSGFQCALAKIYGLITSLAGVRFVEFVGEDFLLFAAAGALARKRRQILVGL